MQLKKPLVSPKSIKERIKFLPEYVKLCGEWWITMKHAWWCSRATSSKVCWEI